MKNYFARLGLTTEANTKTVEKSLTDYRDNGGDELTVKEGRNILTDSLTRTHYNRLHLQYQAMAAASDCLESADARNTHRWLERFVEYPVDEETLDDLGR